MVTEEVADQGGHYDPSPLAVIHEIGGSSEVADLPVPLFSPQPYIPMENKLVTVEDTALGDSGVVFALAHSVTLPRDRESLESIRTPELGIISFQCLIAVSLLLSFD